MLIWVAHDGGYNSDTWYWGALVLLAVLAVTVIVLGDRRPVLSRMAIVALATFGLYLAWSYLSMTWSGSPGAALEGSNRTLLYVIVFALFLILPWTPEAALIALLGFVLVVGAIAIVLLLRLASHDHILRLLVDGRLVSPTGYFNSSVALFMINALLAIVLASRRELPGLLRGLLIAIAGASLQLCVMGQSRGWLFTAPLAALLTIAVVPDRLRVAAAAVLPVAAALIPVHKLLHVFESHAGVSLDNAAASAGRTSLLICAAIFFVSTLCAWIEKVARPPRLSARTRRGLGIVVTTVTILAAGGGALAATHGDPFGFVKRQWHGFSHPAAATSSGSHFGAVGSGRYDFWRVSLDAVAAHPIGGLGQDNFANYYVPRRHTAEEPRWTHSLELRLLAHSGIVGFALFAAFLIAAVAVALPALRSRHPMTRLVAAAALIPLGVWVLHGSVDWFWEIPGLTGPALGFLGMSAALGLSARGGVPRPGRTQGLARAVPIAAAAVAFLAAVLVLAFPYLSVRETSAALTGSRANVDASLRDLARAADLNPLSPDPDRIAGTLALQSGEFTTARKRFERATARDPGGWFAWLGAGLAASALGDNASAKRDFQRAAAINTQDFATKTALARVDTLHPLKPGEALQLLASSLA
jgi:hypothetical protein